jgi:hypothetical protein
MINASMCNIVPCLAGGGLHSSHRLKAPLMTN